MRSARAWMYCGGFFDAAGHSHARVRTLELQIDKALRHPEQVRPLLQELKPLRARLARIDALSAQLEELRDLKSLAKAEDDTAVLADVAESAAGLALSIAQAKKDMRFSGPHDHLGAYLEVSAGAGGTEAQDFAQLLVRMYERFCRRKSFVARFLHARHTPHKGLREATIAIRGLHAYG